jgi:hypothetical protein
MIKTAVSRLMRHDSLWRLLEATVVKGSRYMERERRKHEEVRRRLPEQVFVDKAIQQICPDLRVRHGFFKGMRYPQNRSVASALFPKLLGTYERELHPVLECICTRPYKAIVNIGCAEGYYAVGLALRVPSANVYAFDLNPQALALCRQMASLNGVGERVITDSLCDAATLKRIPFGGRGLVVCDCEGYEKQLFTDEIVRFLADHDILVELHDGVDITISTYIQRAFERTHQIEMIESLDDIKKARTYSYPELESYDLAARKMLVGEGRPHIMEWLFIQSRRWAADGAPKKGGAEHKYGCCAN